MRAKFYAFDALKRRCTELVPGKPSGLDIFELVLLGTYYIPQKHYRTIFRCWVWLSSAVKLKYFWFRNTIEIQVVDGFQNNIRMSLLVIGMTFDDFFITVLIPALDFCHQIPLVTSFFHCKHNSYQKNRCSCRIGPKLSGFVHLKSTTISESYSSNP